MRHPLVYSLVAAAVVSAFVAAISSAASDVQATVKLTASHQVANNLGSCAPLPTRIRTDRRPVWAQLKIHNRNNVLVTGIGLMIRRYVGPQHAVEEQPGVFSGCWVLLTYRPNDIPRRLCITIKAGLTAPDGACQPVTRLPSGQRSVVFEVLAP